jgi:hypothetical protein
MSTIDRNRLNISVHNTSVRQTPQPAVRQFAAVVSQGGQAIVRAALAVAQHVPGADMATAALRGAGMPNLESSGNEGGAGADLSAAPLVATPAGAAVNNAGGPASGGGGSVESPSGTNANAPTTGDGDMLSRGQEMSMRMLRLQESMAEENRRYTALSNVMHARHEMAKNAINNIR